MSPQARVQFSLVSPSLYDLIGGSANGRPAAFDSANLGSNPSPPASLVKNERTSPNKSSLYKSLFTFRLIGRPFRSERNSRGSNPRR